MAFTTQTHAGMTFADRFNALRNDFVEAQKKRKIYRATMTELTNLTDRDLNDLGINRTMIKRLALEAAGYN